jgi:uncharacterized protein YciI
MPFVITWLDGPGTTREMKTRVRSTHIEFIERNKHRIVASGGLFPDDDDFPNGGLIILDVPTRQEAVDYIESDPFFMNGIFREYSIRRWKKFIFDHQRV